MSGFLKLSGSKTVEELNLEDFLILVGARGNIKIKYKDLISLLNISSAVGNGAPIYFEGNTLPTLNNSGEPLVKGNWVILTDGDYGNGIILNDGQIGFGIFNGSTWVLTNVVDLPNPTADGVIKKGDEKAVSGNVVSMFTEDKIQFMNYNPAYAQSAMVYHLNDCIVSIKSSDTSGYLVLNSLSMNLTTFAMSIAKLSTPTETQNTLSNYTIASINYTVEDMTTAGVRTVRFNSINNNGVYVEITLNLSKLWANYTVFNSRPDTSYMNAGFKSHLIEKISTYSNIINVESSSSDVVKNRASLLKRVIKEIKAFDEILLTDYVFIHSFFRGAAPNNDKYYLYLSKKPNPGDVATSGSPGYVGMAIIQATRGQIRANIVDQPTQTIIVGEVFVDLDLIPDINIYYDVSNNPNYLTRGIKQTGIINATRISNSSPSIEFNSVFDAFADKTNKKVIVGETVLKTNVFPPISKFDYQPLFNKEIPNLTLESTRNWIYSTRNIKLRDYYDGYYYFQNDYHVVRTQDLNTPTSGWEIVASTSKFAGLYPITNIKIINGELVMSGRMSTSYCYWWIDLNTLDAREVTFDGVTDTKYTAPTNGSCILPFSISTYGNIYLMALYDVGTSGVSRGSAQIAFISNDRGKTFTKFFDYDTSNIIGWSTANKQKESFHIHGITYDPYWRRIWMHTGDGATYLDNTSVFWTDDEGATWRWRKHTEKENPTGSRQVMNSIPFPDHLLCLTDSVDVGVSRINRNDKTTFTIENAVLYPPRELYAWARNYVWHKGVLYMTFGYQQGATGAGGFLLSTIDGYSFKRVWIDETLGVVSDASMWVVSDGERLFLSLNNTNGSTLVFDV